MKNKRKGQRPLNKKKQPLTSKELIYLRQHAERQIISFVNHNSLTQQ